MSRWTAAMSLAGTPEASWYSAITWNTVSVTRATPAVTVTAGRSSARHRRGSPARRAPGRGGSGGGAGPGGGGGREAGAGGEERGRPQETAAATPHPPAP